MIRAAAPLHVRSHGNVTDAPSLHMLHGWGLHGDVFAESAAALSARRQVHCIDLPGHGHSDLGSDDFEPERLLARLAATANTGHNDWLGWSLGGLAVLAFAIAQPACVRRLVLVAATPSFAVREDWPSAMPLSLLDDFAAQLQDDYDATLSRFLALQTRGAAQAQSTLRELRARLAAARPAPDALAGGLRLLREGDLRARLDAVTCPVLIVTGGRDRLVPPAAGAALAARLPDARLVCIDDAGHAPFLSHAARFNAMVREFLDD